MLKERHVATIFLRIGSSNQEVKSKAPIDPSLGKNIIFAWLEGRGKIMVRRHDEHEVNVIGIDLSGDETSVHQHSIYQPAGLRFPHELRKLIAKLRTLSAGLKHAESVRRFG